MQDEQKSMAEKQYGTEKSTLKHSESKENHEYPQNSITNSNTMTNSNTFYSLDTENNGEMGDRNKLEHINDTDFFSINEIMELKELLTVKHKLMKVVNEESSSYNSNTNSHSINNITFDDIQPQTILISRKVFKEFKEFTKEHNTTLKQSVSLALLNYMNGFRNK